MQDYLIVKGQIDPIENENVPEAYKANEWLQWAARAFGDMFGCCLAE